MIFVFSETTNNKFKKAALEAVSYAKSIANQTSDQVTAITTNAENPEELKKYGADEIIHIQNDDLKEFKPNSLIELLTKISGTEMIVLSHTNLGATLAPLLAIKKSANIITNLLEKPSAVSPFTAKRKSFSGKGIMTVETNSTNLVLTVLQNAFGVFEAEGTGNVTAYSEAIDTSNENIKIESIETASDVLDLKEAELVVSAGRGLKAAENWTMVEELATILGAATACSKPVSDLGWRPHSEHVGQTGKAISPNLYIAIGISGAIQHLAGVNSSKTIVVINNDADAPFFKAADYGIVGDAFDVVPKLIQSLKEFKAS